MVTSKFCFARMVIISVGRSSFPVCPWPQCSLWGALGRTKLHNPQYRVLCLTCRENNHKNGGARINEASKVCVAFGPAELLCFEDLSPKLSVQGMDFRANIFFFFSQTRATVAKRKHSSPHRAPWSTPWMISGRWFGRRTVPWLLWSQNSRKKMRYDLFPSAEHCIFSVALEQRSFKENYHILPNKFKMSRHWKARSAYVPKKW